MSVTLTSEQMEHLSELQNAGQYSESYKYMYDIAEAHFQTNPTEPGPSRPEQRGCSALNSKAGSERLGEK
jgi:hypothetical protein